MPAQRGQLADRTTVARYDEGFTSVDTAHDLTALIAELSLTDLRYHGTSVARRATGAQKYPARDWGQAGSQSI